jgi:hypothetical protein
MTEIADIVPSAPQATDRLLVRRGTGTKSVELVSLPVPDLLIKSSRMDVETPVGWWFDNLPVSAAQTNYTNVADTLRLYPMCRGRRTRVDRIGCRVVTGVASAEARLLIYGVDANFFPKDRLLQTASLDFSVNASTREETIDFTFEAGVPYYVGIHSSSTPAIGGVATASVASLGRPALNQTHPAGGFTRNIPYADGSPADFDGANAGNIANAAAPSIMFRRAE